MPGTGAVSGALNCYRVGREDYRLLFRAILDGKGAGFPERSAVETSARQDWEKGSLVKQLGPVLLHRELHPPDRPEHSPVRPHPLLPALGESLAKDAQGDREQRIQIQRLPVRIELGRDATLLMRPSGDVAELLREFLAGLHRRHSGPHAVEVNPLIDRVPLRPPVREATNAVSGHKFGPHFLLTEWEQVVDAWQLETWERESVADTQPLSGVPQPPDRTRRVGGTAARMDVRPPLERRISAPLAARPRFSPGGRRSSHRDQSDYITIRKGDGRGATQRFWKSQ